MSEHVGEGASSVEQRILDACPMGDTDPTITFEQQYRRRGGITIYKWWLSESEHRTLTRAERSHLLRLLAEGRLEEVHGWQHGRGYVGRKRP